MSKTYLAKILLFGEHTVIKGSKALAMPISSHSGSWKYTTNQAKKKQLQQQLSQLLGYLIEQSFESLLDLAQFEADLQKGLYFQSTIPTGYGLGSSGALCAAIYDTYKRSTEEPPLLTLKQQLGRMESFFHGASSGMDPLVSYLNYPVLVAGQNQIEPVQIPSPSKMQETPTIFLLDTQIKRETATFVNGFLQRCQDALYNQRCQTQLVPLVNQAIEAFLNGQWPELFPIWAQISQFQYQYFDFMIPESFRAVWLAGLEGDAFKLKICGAGGGGFLLGITYDFEATAAQLKDYAINKILTQV